jgi:hypothetical protein
VRQAIGTTKIAPGSIFHRYLVREIGRDAALADLLARVVDSSGTHNETVDTFLKLVLKR